MRWKTWDHFLKFSIRLSVRKSREKLETNVWKIQSKSLQKFIHRYAPQIFQHNPLFCSLVYKSYFFSKQLFYGNYSTLHSHTNTVVSYPTYTVEMASKTVKRSIAYLNWKMICFPQIAKVENPVGSCIATGDPHYTTFDGKYAIIIIIIIIIIITSDTSKSKL